MRAHLQVSCGPATAFARGQLAYAATLAALYAAAHLTDSALAPRPAPLLDTVKAADTGAPQTAEELQNVGTEAGVSVPVTDRPAGFASRAMARHAARCGAEVAVVQAAAAFTWQACQKMLLQEATRCACVRSRASLGHTFQHRDLFTALSQAARA